MNALRNERAYPGRKTEYDSVERRRREAKRSGNVREVTRRELEERGGERKRAPRDRVQETPHAKAEAAPRKKSGVFSTIVITLAIFCILAFVVYRYSAVYSSEREINGIKTRIEELTTENEKLKTRIAIAEDIESVRERASEELHMSFPDEEQVVKIALIDRPVDLKLIETQTEEEDGITLKAIINSLIGR